MKFQWKHGEGRCLSVRDIIGIFVLCAAILVCLFLARDKNFSGALGERKIFKKADRELKIKISVDPVFLLMSGSTEKAANEIFLTVSGASEIFERDFGIRLKICGDISLWDDFEKNADIDKFRREISSGPCDIAVLFTGRVIGNDAAIIGLRKQRSIFVRSLGEAGQNFKGRSLTLAHEIGHVFFAFHTESGIMAWDSDYSDESWDELNWRIIIFMKYKNFHKYDFFPRKLRP